MGTNVYKPQSSNIGLIVVSIIISLVSVAISGFLYFKMDSDRNHLEGKIFDLTSRLDCLGSSNGTNTSINDDDNDDHIFQHNCYNRSNESFSKDAL